MTPFNTNKNGFSSSVQSLKSDLHAFLVAGIPKGSRSQQKRSLVTSVTNAIDAIDTDDFGIRVIVIKTKS